MKGREFQFNAWKKIPPLPACLFKSLMMGEVSCWGLTCTITNRKKHTAHGPTQATHWLLKEKLHPMKHQDSNLLTIQEKAISRLSWLTTCQTLTGNLSLAPSLVSARPVNFNGEALTSYLGSLSLKHASGPGLHSTVQDFDHSAPGLFSATISALYRNRTLHAFYCILKVPFVELVPPSAKCSLQSPLEGH
eukprot:1153141-Pelagomonas_calceolata.AAC.2